MTNILSDSSSEIFIAPPSKSISALCPGLSNISASLPYEKSLVQSTTLISQSSVICTNVASENEIASKSQGVIRSNNEPLENSNNGNNDFINGGKKLSAHNSVESNTSIIKTNATNCNMPETTKLLGNTYSMSENRLPDDICRLNGPNGHQRRILRPTVATYHNWASKFEPVCKNCGDDGIVVYDQHSGDQLCSQCGLVLEAKFMSDEQEWRNFNNDDSGYGIDRSRVGSINNHWMEGCSHGTGIIGGSRKLQYTHEVATGASTGDKMMKGAFHSLLLIAEAFSLRDNVIERGKEIIKVLQETGTLKKRGTLLNMLAVVYLACREAGVGRTIRELAIYDRNITERDLGKAIHRLKKLLPDSSYSYASNCNNPLYPLSTYNSSFAPFPDSYTPSSNNIGNNCCQLGLTANSSVNSGKSKSNAQLFNNASSIHSVHAAGSVLYETACELITRFCSRLKIGPIARAVSEHICSRAAEVINRSHRPNSVAAGAIFLAVRLMDIKEISCSNIATVAGAAENTVKSVYKEMLFVAEHLLPQDFTPTITGGLSALRRAPNINISSNNITCRNNSNCTGDHNLNGYGSNSNNNANCNFSNYTNRQFGKISCNSQNYNDGNTNHIQSANDEDKKRRRIEH